MRVADGRGGRFGTGMQLGRGAAVVLFGAAVAWYLTLASPAYAGPPIHPADPREISGLNHACGTAIDSEGDVYVSSAGASKVEVYDSELGFLASITNANTPCGLAVNSKGEVFVSEKSTGKVVRYKPNAFPFSGPLTYGSAEPIDSSGAAKGIAIDPLDGRLYVAEGDHVAVYKSDGSFEGNILEGEVSGATGMAVYSYVVSPGSSDRHVYVAEDGANRVKIFDGTGSGSGDSTTFSTPKLHRTIETVDHDGNPGTPDEPLDLLEASLAVDAGNRSDDGKCNSIAEQACTAGHLLLFDAGQSAVYEFDASGELLDQLPSPPNLVDAEPTAMAIDRSGGGNDGTIYVTTGNGSGAKLLAFNPLAAPSRLPLFALSEKLNKSERLKKAAAVTVDHEGYVYVAAGALIHILDSSGEEIAVGPAGKGIEDGNHPVDLAVDSEGNLYVADSGEPFGGDETVTYYTPSEYPPVGGTTYTRHEPELVDEAVLGGRPEMVAVNPANDHLLVTGWTEPPIHSVTIEFDSIANGSGEIREIPFNFGARPQGIGVHSATGKIYVSEQDSDNVSVVESGGNERVARITGGGCPGGRFGQSSIAVDQSNGHVLVFANGNGTAREYDAYGACVAEFAFPPPQDFTTSLSRPYDIAIDNSGGPGNGRVYVAFDDEKPNTPDLWAFSPLSYGAVPSVTTGIASGVGGGNATLNGEVNPNGFPLTACGFEYISAAQRKQNEDEVKDPFEGAAVVACVETLGEIGSGSAPVAIHADIGILEPEERYFFRPFAANKFGPNNPVPPGLFGPPLLSIESPLPVSYTEATLRANVDPSGLPTKVHFEYGLEPGVYDHSTPVQELDPTAGPTQVLAPLTGLKEGTRYYLRAVVENEAKELVGSEQSFETRKRELIPPCPNDEYRTGLSTNLPECRAYELVTPGETKGLTPRDEQNPSAGAGFNNWLAMPRGAGAGDRVAYFTLGTLPGFDGTGILDGYRAQRGEGAHPVGGWVSELVGPTYEEAVPRITNPVGQQSMSSDQLYTFWKIEPAEFFPRTFPAGIYLSTPGKATGSACNPEPLQADFELVGCGTLGTDPKAQSHFLSPAGTHVIFGSEAHLETSTPLAGTSTNAVYDRVAGAASATVVSLKPDGSVFADGEDATYVAATEDGSAVAFKVGGNLYLRRAGQTTQIATAPNTYAGISLDGQRVFYADANLDPTHPQPAGLFACNVSGGSCAGPEKAQEPISIAQDAIFVNVSADGSKAFFTSKSVPVGVDPNENGEEGEAGEHNLFAWSAEGSAVAFVSTLHSDDFVDFDGDSTVTLGRWTTAINPSSNIGIVGSPARSTPDGKVLLFQSHAQLTGYDNEGHGQIYRYDPAGAAGEQLLCVSCHPGKAPASADAMLATAPEGVVATTMIANVTDGGTEAFFQSPDPLLPEDANDVQDVYEWRANGVGSCTEVGGCLALISTGKGENNSYLYGMSADGHDVFFRTQEKLVGADVPGSPSIYDARVGGGIPEPPSEPVCTGDACQGNGTPAPALPAPASTGPGEEGKKPPCLKGKRRVKGRCVKKQHAKRKQHRANHDRRAHR